MAIPFALHSTLALDTVEVTRLPLCRVLLMNDRRFPWLILVPERDSVREIYELSVAERAELIEEIARASEVLKRLFQPDKLNFGALGNIVPQLHVHIVARTATDPAWPVRSGAPARQCRTRRMNWRRSGGGWRRRSRRCRRSWNGDAVGDRAMKKEQAEMTYPRSGAQLAFARAATAFAAFSIGALGMGALAIGAVAIGRLAVRRLALQKGAIDRLVIHELEVGRLRVRELITDERAETREGFPQTRDCVASARS